MRFSHTYPSYPPLTSPFFPFPHIISGNPGCCTHVRPLHQRLPPFFIFSFLCFFVFSSRIHRNLATAQMVFLSHQIYVDYVVRFGDKVALDEITLYASCSSFLRLRSTKNLFVGAFLFFFFLGGGLFLALHLYRFPTYTQPSPPHPLTPTYSISTTDAASHNREPSLRLTPLHRSNNPYPPTQTVHHGIRRTIVRPHLSSTNT